jgi:hypothetical protein
VEGQAEEAQLRGAGVYAIGEVGDEGGLTVSVTDRAHPTRLLQHIKRLVVAGGLAHPDRRAEAEPVKRRAQADLPRRRRALGGDAGEVRGALLRRRLGVVEELIAPLAGGDAEGEAEDQGGEAHGVSREEHTVARLRGAHQSPAR